MKTLNVATRAREEMLDVTDQVREAVSGLGLGSGVCLVFSPHTTCAITVNEGWDPDVQADALRHLRSLVPQDAGFAHSEGNSDSHIKTMAVGPSVLLPVEGGELRLGRWQAVFLCEFDGPRQREVWVQAMSR
ncbi:MAG: YjbQ family protein [Candidatus Dormibacteraeota bacterium]|nr:YjbQ family protein [Candidatus Dormibacteraeota bacterium]